MSQDPRSRVQLEIHVAEHHPWVIEHGIAELQTQEGGEDYWVGTGFEFLVLSPPPAWDEELEILNELIREAALVSDRSPAIAGEGPVDALLAANAAGWLEGVERIVLIAALDVGVLLSRADIARVLAGMARHYRPGNSVAIVMPGRDQIELKAEQPLVGGFGAEGFRQVPGYDVWVMGGFTTPAG